MWHDFLLYKMGPISVFLQSWTSQRSIYKMPLICINTLVCKHNEDSEVGSHFNFSEYYSLPHLHASVLFTRLKLKKVFYILSSYSNKEMHFSLNHVESLLLCWSFWSRGREALLTFPCILCNLSFKLTQTGRTNIYTRYWIPEILN